MVEGGGSLGIGERRAAIPIARIRFGGPNERARLDTTASGWNGSAISTATTRRGTGFSTIGARGRVLYR